SLALRALLALVLLVGFYVLAIGMVALLLALPVLEVLFIERIHIQLALVSLFGAAAVAWSILPRFDRFEVPGALLTRDTQPRLFAELEDVATRAGQAMPREVYLVPQVNAFVTQRGGVLGLGSRRVMGLGLPLLQALTVPQLRA